MNQPAAGPKHLCFLAACITMLLTAAAHTAAHLAGPAPPKSADEAELLRLMQSVPLELLGVTRTMIQITSGFSWMFSGSFVLLGALGIAIWKSRRADRGLMRTVAASHAVFLITMAVMSAFLFPPPPTVFFALAGVLFAIDAAAR